MIDGILLGALIFMLGIATGFGLSWLVALRYEKERNALQVTVGRLMQELEAHQVPIDEM